MDYLFLFLCSFTIFSVRTTSQRVPCYSEEPIRFFDSRDRTFEGYLYIGAELEIRNGYYLRGALCMDMLPIIHTWPERFVRAYNLLLEHYHASETSLLMSDLDAILNDLDADVISHAIDDLDFGFLADLQTSALSIPPPSPIANLLLDANPRVENNVPNGNIVTDNILPVENVSYVANYGPIESVVTDNVLPVENSANDNSFPIDNIIRMESHVSFDNFLFDLLIQTDSSAANNVATDYAIADNLSPIEADAAFVGFFNNIPLVENNLRAENNTAFGNNPNDSQQMETNRPVEVVEFDMDDTIDHAVSPIELDSILREFAEIASMADPYEFIDE